MKQKKNIFLLNLFFLFLTMTTACSSDSVPDETGRLVSPDGESSDCKAWTDFDNGKEENVLIDFSYAGYERGESEPPEVSTLGYTMYNVADYGAIPDDGKSDREALLKVFQAIGIDNHKAKPRANVIIYFPEGEYILYDAEDEAKQKETGEDVRFQLLVGNFILKGAGRDKTILTMAAPYPALSGVEWAGAMFDIKNWNGFSQELAKVTGNSAKGQFSVEVSSTTNITKDSRVCLKLQDNSPDAIAKELSPYSAIASMTDLFQNGVQVHESHKVKSVSGNRVTFYEPIMHAVDPRWKWTITRYNCYENVGVEDLAFKGQMGTNFVHSQWYENSTYKPLNFQQIANGWVRRVDFISVSEAATFTSCADVSAYDIRIMGNRGHCSVHAAGSSRTLITKVTDTAKSSTTDNAGQWHAVGVSKQSIGTVIKDCTWGDDTNFESHATQPRATLIDRCTGGFLQSHQGGATSQLPNHLDDLTLWNFCATNALSNETANWIWWSESRDWKFLPPTIVGFHGQKVNFAPQQVKLDESNGTPVTPSSLYEAQLKRRLKTLPNVSYLK